VFVCCGLLMTMPGMLKLVFCQCLIVQILLEFTSRGVAEVDQSMLTSSETWFWSDHLAWCLRAT